MVFQFPESLTEFGSDWSMKMMRWEQARLESKNKYKNMMACTGPREKGDQLRRKKEIEECIWGKRILYSNSWLPE